jgi:hypothetical protein
MINSARPRQRLTAAQRKFLSALCSELNALFKQKLPSELYGVKIRDLLGSVRSFEYAALSNEDKVVIKGDRVILDNEYVSKVYDPADERRRADAILYVLHELVHHAQGIGAKTTVRQLRRSGGEQSLLHADLTADHVAAFLLRHLAPQWSIAFLKDVQGTSLASFPVTDRHSPPAQQRKRLRLLALRADFWARRLGKLSERPGTGYVYIEHTRSLRDLSVLLSGPPISVIGTARLGPKESSLLERVGSPSAPLPLSALDDVLVRELQRLKPPGGEQGPINKIAGLLGSLLVPPKGRPSPA